jgi:CyaY protein
MNTMDEQHFLEQADQTLNDLERWLEAAIETQGLEIDIEPGQGGLLELGFQDGSKIVINRHTAAREIWVATKHFGHHFSPGENGIWKARRDGAELYQTVVDAIKAQGGFVLAMPGENTR